MHGIGGHNNSGMLEKVKVGVVAHGDGGLVRHAVVPFGDLERRTSTSPPPYIYQQTH